MVKIIENVLFVCPEKLQKLRCALTAFYRRRNICLNFIYRNDYFVNYANCAKKIMLVKKNNFRL